MNLSADCLRAGLAEGIGGSATDAFAGAGLDGGAFEVGAFVCLVRDLILAAPRFRLLFAATASESSDSLLIVDVLDPASSDDDDDDIEATRAGFASFLPISIAQLLRSNSEMPDACSSSFDSEEKDKDLLDRDSVDDSSSIFSFRPASCSYIVSIYCAFMGTLVLWCLLSASRLTPNL